MPVMATQTVAFGNRLMNTFYRLNHWIDRLPAVYSRTALLLNLYLTPCPLVVTVQAERLRRLAE